MEATVVPRSLRGAEPWHSLDVGACVAMLEADLERGLRSAEVTERQARDGRNSLPEATGPSLLRQFLGQFASPLIWLLLMAAVVAVAMGERGDAAVIVFVLAVNAAVGTVQERRAERSMASLKRLSRVRARVRRDGVESTVDAVELVPGDVVMLAAGDAVPADLRVFEAAGLCCAEAALTGESVPVDKSPEPVAADAPLAERTSQCFSGTLVSAGRGLGLVVATGPRSELGGIARLTQVQPEVTPLERRLAQFGRFLVVLAGVMFALVLAVGWLRGLPMSEVLMVSISQLVSVVPEGLPVALTVGLAVGMRRMAEQRAIVRRLGAVETLGCTTVICTDKTGTLTQNQMTVERVWHPSGASWKGDGVPALGTLWDALVHCNDATLGAAGQASLGDPTEVALLSFSRSFGPPVRPRLRTSELPFDATRRLMATGHGDVVFVKGAADAVLALCDGREVDGAVVPLDAEARREALRVADEMAEGALRVLAFARCPGPLDAEAGFDGLRRGVLLGLCGEMDPPRAEVTKALQTCRQAGIRVVMVTGDHRATGLAIARRLGMADAGDEAIDGAELAQLMTRPGALAARLPHTAVFARVRPEQKLSIVEAFQAAGHVVAMTGDGINDAPALAKSDVGVAMGKGGTDVAREASDIVITDDDFSTIVRAVEEGRLFYRNIKKATLLLLASSLAEMVILVGAMLLGLPMPFAAVQILWNNLVTEGTITLNLVMDPKEGDELSRPPIPRDEPIVTRAMLGRLLFLGAVISIVVLGFYAWRRALGLPGAQVQTETFTLLAVCEWFNVLNCRSELRHAWRSQLRRNRWLVGGLLVSNVLQLAVVYVAPLGRVFHTVPIGASGVVLIGAVGSLVLWAEELRKAIQRWASRA